MTSVVSPEKFVNWNTGQPISLFDAVGSKFNPIGATHSVGLVPDPGASTTTLGKFLRDDATWANPSFSFNVKAYGAVGDGVTDDTAAILACYNALVAFGRGGTIFFPAGQYKFSSFPTISVPSVIIKGEGRSASGNQGTIFRPSNTTGNDIVINEQYVWLEDLAIIPTVRKTQDFAIVFQNTSFQCGINRLLIQNGFHGIIVTGGSEIHVQEIHMRSMLGSQGIVAFSTTGTFGMNISSFVADNPYPLPYGTVKTWAITTAFNANDIIINNGNIYQCSTGGTSAGAGTGPSGLPSGATAQDVFTNTITDNTVQWKFVANSLTWIILDSMTFSVRLNNVILINALRGLYINDTTNTGITTRPSWIFCNNLECDHNLLDNILFDRGSDVYMSNCWSGSSLNGSGMIVNSNFKGGVQVGTSRFAGNWQHGILIQSGPKACKIINNLVQNNSAAGAGTFHGIAIGAATTDFVIAGNQCGTDPNIGAGNNQGYGVLVNVGASDRYIIEQNLVSGNATGGVLDGGAGVNKSVARNF